MQLLPAVLWHPPAAPEPPCATAIRVRGTVRVRSSRFNREEMTEEQGGNRGREGCGGRGRGGSRSSKAGLAFLALDGWRRRGAGCCCCCNMRFRIEKILLKKKITSQRNQMQVPYHGTRINIMALDFYFFFARSHPIIGCCMARTHINTMVRLPEQQHKKTERQQDVSARLNCRRRGLQLIATADTTG